MAAATSPLAAANRKMTNFRWTICALLFLATTVNYMDRQVLSLTGKSSSPLNSTGPTQTTV